MHEPWFNNTNALNYTKDCIESGWVSTNGNWVKKFESELCQYSKSKNAVALSNGTDALRLALHCVGVKYGEEVLIPPFSFVATANAICHLGAKPHFVDIENKFLGLCPEKLDYHLKKIAT